MPRKLSTLGGVIATLRRIDLTPQTGKTLPQVCG